MGYQLLARNSLTTSIHRDSPVSDAIELAEYEIQNHWINTDKKSFLAMLEEADGGFPVSSRPAAEKSTTAFLNCLHHSETIPIHLAVRNGIQLKSKPRFEQYYRSSLPGERADSLIEWAARNPDLAHKFTEVSLDASSLILPGVLPKIIEGLSYQELDYQSLLNAVTDHQRAPNNHQSGRINTDRSATLRNLARRCSSQSMEVDPN